MKQTSLFQLFTQVDYIIAIGKNQHNITVLVNDDDDDDDNDESLWVCAFAAKMPMFARHILYHI